ncbi:MAG: MBL fold metallo-hydrolase [Bryobacterales bacterium]|nr:MBL fold metallo-hydrolase [Bryobacterales bacterium]
MSFQSRFAWPARCAAALLAAAGLYTAWTQQTPADPPLTVEKIAEDLHVIVGAGGNIGVLTTDEGVILIDDKFDRNVEGILEKVKSISSKPIRYVLNTHLHGDHTGGNARIASLTGAVLFAHANARALMVEKKMPGLQNVTFNDRASIHLGGKTIEAYYFGRSHTNGDVVYYFPDHKVIHTGDMFAVGGPFIDYSSGGSGRDFVRTLAKALELNFETVIPGHGGPVLKKSDLAAFRGELADAEAQIGKLIREGKPKDQARTLLRTADFRMCCKSALWERAIPGLWDELSR